jgi:hypothetical protein
MRRIALAVLAVLSVAPAALRAQSAPARPLLVTVPDARLWAASTAGPPAVDARVAAGMAEPTSRLGRASPGKLATIGLLAAAGSFIGGAYLGGGIENEFFPCSCDDPELRGALLGALLVPQLAIPVTVHLAGDGNVPFLRTLGGSLLGGAAVVAVGAATESFTLGFFGAPIGALVGSVVASR